MRSIRIHSAIPDSQQPTSPIGFLFLKLPPPPCAVLLVTIYTSSTAQGGGGSFNKWFPQQPQRFIFTNLSEACSEAKRWKHLSWVSVTEMAANPVEPDLALFRYVYIYMYVYIHIVIEGSLEVKLPTIYMDRWKAEQGRGREKRKIRRKKSKKKEDADARKGRKVAKHCVFPIIWVSGGSKRRLAKAAGAEPAGQRRDEKLHAVVVRSTFRSQHLQNTACSRHFWRFRCRKSARRCGAKHSLKSKCTKHTMLGPLLEVEMSKRCRPLWREAHFQVKMYKTPHVRATFGSCDVEKVEAVVARSTFRSQNVKNARGSDHFWRFRCRFATLHYTTLHYPTLHYTPLHYTTLHNTTLQLRNYTTTFHYTTTTTTTTTRQLHSTTLN